MKIFLLAMLLSLNAHAVDLTQETQDIICKGTGVQVLIDKRDRFIKVKDAKGLAEYKAVEFLDSGILLKNPLTETHALIQFLPRGEVLLIEGSLTKFLEESCEEVGPAKLCTVGSAKIFWSAEKIELREKQKVTAYDAQHYGVHPNDGTYFIALNEQRQALALLDAGARVLAINGPAKSMNCTYWTNK